MTSTVNGELVNRVQQLRLDGQLGAQTGSGRRGGGSWLPWLLCGLLATSWVGVGVRWYRSAGTPRAADADAAKSPGAAAPQPSGGRPAGSAGAAAPGEVLLQLKGNLIPFLQIAVSPRDVAGEITGITFWEGKTVKQGEVLATLIKSQYDNRYNTDQASVLSAEAQVAKAEAQVVAAAVRVAKAKAALAAADARVTKAVAVQDRATKDFVQARQQRTGNAISAQEYQKFEADKVVADADTVAAKADAEAAAREIEATQAEERTSKAHVRASAAEATAAAARRDESKRLLDNCTIVAPIGGTVLTKKADRGSLVSPAAFNVSASLCEIADLAKLEVEVDVPERQITRVRPGLECQVAADADPNRVYRGVVHRIMPIADDSKNVIKVRIRVYLPRNEEAGSFLKPKMSVVATVVNRPFAPGDNEQSWD
ncbi:MAG TPA: efflux RND transporter periplasmic adaptor subunit [Urbifossiella sp.]|jgi:multidrug resistance efflux pump|nr:efflux RND transporter periplasmic adaptor subunit [Urbifossiella sp.]